MNGYWVFCAPIGYRYERRGTHGKLLVRDEPVASIIQEALEGYASGRFESQAEVKRFLESQPLFPKDLPNGQIRQQKVTDILNRVVYAGYIEALNWDIPRRKGHHEAMISLGTFERIQQRRKQVAKAPARADISTDFPLRGFVTCGDCNKPLTACWSTSKTGKRHPYYWCHNRACDNHRKSIRRDVMERDFESVLQTLTPSTGMLAVAKRMFKTAWDDRLSQAEAVRDGIGVKIRKLDKQINGLLDRIVESTNTTVITAFETRIDTLEREKQVLAEQQSQKAKPAHSFDEMFELATAFLANPWKLWESGNISLRRMVLKLAFVQGMPYSRETGVRTPQLSVMFEFLGKFTQKCQMVRSGGLEPPRVLPHSDLNAARLPIPPRPQVLKRERHLAKRCGHLKR